MSIPAINVQRTESGNIIKVDESEPDNVDALPFRVRDVIIKHHDVTEEYKLLEYLGRGRFGEVNRCENKATGEIFACKKINTERPSDKKEVMLEIEVMKQLQHPMLLQLVDAFEIEKHMLLVTEYIAGGELFDRVIEDEFVLTEKACVMFLRQICEGVGFMHSKNVVHLDLKPENILCLTRTGNRIKIIDFGLARHYKPGQQLHVLFGTPEFMAPEVVNYEPISVQADMWSVGVITYILISGLSPFMGNIDSETLANVSRGTYSFDYEDFAETSNECKDFIAKLLIKDPKKRLTAAQCLDHTWLKKSRKKMLSMKRMKTTRLKLFVYRRKWQKLVNTIVALKRMGFIMNKNNGNIKPVLGLHDDKPPASKASSEVKPETPGRGSSPSTPISTTVNDVKKEPSRRRSNLDHSTDKTAETPKKSSNSRISEVKNTDTHERASRVSPGSAEKKSEAKLEEKTTRASERQRSSPGRNEKQSEIKSEDLGTKRSQRSSPLRSEIKSNEKVDKSSDRLQKTRGVSPEISKPTKPETKVDDIPVRTSRVNRLSPIKTEKKSDELPKRPIPEEPLSKPRNRVDEDSPDIGIRPRRQSPAPVVTTPNSASRLSPLRSSPARQSEEPLRSIGRDRRSPPARQYEEPLHAIGRDRKSPPARNYEEPLRGDKRSSPVRHQQEHLDSPKRVSPVRRLDDDSHLGIGPRSGRNGHQLYHEPEMKQDAPPTTGRINMNLLVPETNKSYGGQEGPCSLPRVFVERLAPPDNAAAQAPKEGKKKQRMYKPKSKN
ncbi:probable serine/threonine-protein kinase fhkE [Lingula anatina]|uniref:Probable serine/threonine-protein kinase fhkE n=1 Tax=Lingula anatina TaxID=7574 RepID=A0A1S3IEG4_LINAN|nr:probable serine/threonine-protein kinase fhkE [Lingula anatina]|eukprot:XP_013396622.1 probable serine/threonine-protein kinase fhkE [Lingula anatina]